MILKERFCIHFKEKVVAHTKLMYTPRKCNVYLPHVDKVDAILRHGDDTTQGVVHTPHVGQNPVKVDRGSVTITVAISSFSCECQWS